MHLMQIARAVHGISPEVASTISGDTPEEISLSSAVRTLILGRPEISRAKERRPSAKKKLPQVQGEATGVSNLYSVVCLCKNYVCSHIDPNHPPALS